MRQDSFNQRLNHLDKIRCYRFGVTDSIDALVKGHENNYGAHALWSDDKKGHKKHNKEIRLRSEGYLQALRDLLSVLASTNEHQVKELIRFARWAEGADDED